MNGHIVEGLQKQWLRQEGVTVLQECSEQGTEWRDPSGMWSQSWDGECWGLVRQDERYPADQGLIRQRVLCNKHKWGRKGVKRQARLSAGNKGRRPMGSASEGAGVPFCLLSMVSPSSEDKGRISESSFQRSVRSQPRGKFVIQLLWWVWVSSLAKAIRTYI